MPIVAIFSLCVTGASSLILQMLLVREWTAVFYGNELFLGWIFFSWLLWSSVLSFFLGRWIPMRTAARIAAPAHALIALLTPVLIWIARMGRAWTAPAMALPDLPRAMLFTFLLTSPVSALIACLFVTVTKDAGQAHAGRFFGMVIGLAYLWETAGFVMGGLLFSYMLVLTDTFAAATVVQWANVAAAAAWYASPQRRSLLARLALALAAAAATFATAAGPALSRRSILNLFPAQAVIEHASSIYGTYTITRLGPQYNFYSGGSLVGSDADTEWNEQVVHLPLLCHPHPKRILLIGGGFTGALREVLKHDPEQVDYIEPNPALLHAARAYLSADARSALDDSRVRIIAEDGRRFMNRMRIDFEGPRYDAILINMGDPSTLFLNRYYTVECLQQARALLATGGLVATHISFSPDFIGPEQLAFTAVIYETLRKVFPSVTVWAEYAAFFIASADASFSPDFPLVRDHLARRPISASFINPAVLEYRLTTDRNRQLLEALQPSNESPNRDLHPRATFLAVVRWAHMLHPAMAKGLAMLGRISPIWLVAAWAFWACAFAMAVRRASAAALMMSMSTVSFTVMACETSILLMFQVAFGYLYYRIALIVTAVMLGFSAGSYLGLRFPAGSSRRLSVIHTAIMAVVIAPLWAAARANPWTHGGSATLLQAILMIAALAVGGLGGFEFAAANQIFFAEGQTDHKRTGWLYGADLLGSCCGALLTGLWLFPVLGLNTTLAALFALNAVAAAALAGRPLSSSAARAS